MTEEKDKVSEEVKVEEKKEKKSRYGLVEVTTQTGIAVRDNNKEKIFNQEELFVEVLNKLDKIERAIA